MVLNTAGYRSLSTADGSVVCAQGYGEQPAGMTPEDISLVVPKTWRRRAMPEHGLLVCARAAVVPPSGVPPEITLRCTLVETDLGAWREQAVAELAERLVDFELEDSDQYDLRGLPVVYQRFAHRPVAVDVLTDQWSWLTDGLGVTLSCSAARTDYPDYCDVFEWIAETVRIGPRAA